MYPDASILIVDDRPENLVAMQAMLEEEVGTIITAKSGNEALSLLLDRDFALVLLDVQMPGMDGFETAELMRINSRTKTVPIIFVTAVSTEQKFVFRGYEAGAIDYIFKPVDPFILKSKVILFLELYERRAALERSLEANRMLMREIHHRVKNNLTIVSSLIGLQEQFLKDPADEPLLEELRMRVDAVALVYEMVHKSGKVTELDMKKYLTDLADGVMASGAAPAGIVHGVDADEVILPVDTGVTVGLIVNELLTNAIKYAFPSMDGKAGDGKDGAAASQPPDAPGNVRVEFHLREGTCTLTVSDDGVGFGGTFGTTSSFGLNLVASLARQLHGEARKEPSGRGSTFAIVFPAPQAS